jgi:3'(2'), 5'-bisphosphate nucleotidase
VTQTSDLAAATLTQSHTRDPDKPSRRVQLLKPANLIESYSAGIKLAFVARGQADVYLNTYHEVHDWDLCAGHILVTEAGGKVTKLDGSVIRYGLVGAIQRGGVLASNWKLHDAAIARIK